MKKLDYRTPGQRTEDARKARRMRSSVCLNSDCRLYNIEIETKIDEYYDADLDTTLQIHDTCPQCKNLLYPLNEL